MQGEINHMPYKFKVGDKIEFECARGYDFPRWSPQGKDEGSSGKYISGFVTAVTDELISIEYCIPGFYETVVWSWPNEGHPNYNEWQWYRKGYLRKYKSPNSCVCGCEAVYGPDTNLHSYWCSKFKKERQ